MSAWLGVLAGVVSTVAQPSITSFTLLVLFDALDELNSAKIGPQRLGHIDFRIRQLPEQEVAQAHFSAGANDQVGIGQIASVEVVADRLLVHFQMMESAIARRGFGQRTEGVD